jgi:hypothetical protein
MKNDFESAIDELYEKVRSRLSNKKEIQKVSLINQSSRDESGNIVWYEKYLEFLLKGTVLNEKDIDLLDVEVRYKYLDNGHLTVEGSFYDSSGFIIDEFKISDSGDTIAEKVIPLIKKMISLYESAIENYILPPQRQVVCQIR